MTASRRTTDDYASTMGLGEALAGLHSVHVSDGERLAHLSGALADSERKRENLEVALQSARRIGAAIGIVMTVMKLTEEDAFALLVKISQEQNRKLRVLVDDIVLTGTF